MDSCWFESNAAEEAGGAVSGSVTAIGCTFVRNSARSGWGGAVDGSGVYRNCYFENNGARSGARAAYAKQSSLIFEDCIFTGHGGTEGGVVRTFGGALTLRRCVFFDNGNHAVQVVGPINGSGAFASVESCTFVANKIALYAMQGGARIEAMQSIFAGNVGVVFRTSGEVIQIGCSDVWSNDDNSGYSTVPSPNISEDPLFCDAINVVFTLNFGSPCLPEQSSECGLIGALSQGCGAVPVGGRSLGSLKTRFSPKRPNDGR